VLSRYDLSQFAGHQVTPRFSLFTDADPAGYDLSLIGWYLDDISIYTCDPNPVATSPSAVRALAATGSLRGMTISWQPPAANAAGVREYQIAVSPCSVRTTVPASTTSLALVTDRNSCGGLLQVSVWAIGPPGQGSPMASITVQVGGVSVSAKRSGSRLAFKGAVSTSDRHPVAGGLVAIQRKSPAGWVTVRTVRTQSTGRFSTTYRHRKHASYRAAFLGGPGLIGSASSSRRW
jgi:hypothetical protein